MPFFQKQKPMEIGPKHPLRKPLLDALRPRIEGDLKQPVLFRVTKLQVLGDFAFVVCEPRTPADKPIDFKKTRYRSEIEQGVFDGATTYALLKKAGGKWKAVEHVIGPTDVAWSNWAGPPHNAPNSLLGLPD
ncbi:hypothetical protein [Armatimonas sp.]|uniref:hypothetical protein n=1 Tax=Armatimonas sp. TaxID=1872638 RepID=UPI00286B93C4|nr:hypothetical protein [Armatimonas sp.]